MCVCVCEREIDRVSVCVYVCSLVAHHARVSTHRLAMAVVVVIVVVVAVAWCILLQNERQILVEFKLLHC